MKIKNALSFMLSAVMLSANINLTQVSAGQVLYGDYVLCRCGQSLLCMDGQ